MSDIQGSKAILLVQHGGIRELTHARTFEVDGSKGETYTVTVTARRTTCTCEAGHKGQLCYHVRGARLLMANQRDTRGAREATDYS